MNETEELETRNKLQTRNRWTTLRNYKQINKKKKEERNMETIPEKDGNFIRNSHLQARERREKEWSCRERIKQCRWDWKDLAYLFFWSRIEISFSFVERREWVLQWVGLSFWLSVSFWLVGRFVEEEEKPGFGKLEEFLVNAKQMLLLKFIWERQRERERKQQVVKSEWLIS